MSGYRDVMDDTFAVRNVNERPPSYECIMALNEAFLLSQSKVAPSPRNSIFDFAPEGLHSKRTVDMNGNIAQSAVADQLNNNNSDGINASATTDDEAIISEHVEANVEINDSNNNSNDEDENATELDLIKSNGIVKLDMARIMDSTGLPTYDAALKLKSSNYI